jgi:hypothetical protein
VFSQKQYEPSVPQTGKNPGKPTAAITVNYLFRNILQVSHCPSKIYAASPRSESTKSNESKMLAAQQKKMQIEEA